MIKKIVRISLIILLLLLGTAFALPFLLKGKLINLAKKEVNKQVNARVDFSNEIDLSVFRNFPRLSMGLKQVKVIGVDTFSRDTLAHIKEIDVSFNLWSVIGGDNIEIEGIALNEPTVYLKVLGDGRANWDIAKAGTDTAAAAGDTASNFSMALQDVSIQHGKLIYDDKSSDFYLALSDFSHKMEGDFTKDNFTLETNTSSPQLVLGYGGLNYLSGVKADIKANLEMDMKNMKFSFGSNEAKLNDLPINAKGWVKLNENDMDMDISFAALKSDFKSFISLLPAVYTKDFASLNASGKMALDGYMRGKLTETTLPAFNMNVAVEKASMKYASLPQSINNIDFKLNIFNPNGNTDATVINLDPFRMTMGGEPFSAALLLKTPESNPWMKGFVNGHLNLAQFAQYFPLEKGTKLSGEVKADIKAEGYYKQIEKGNYSAFNASGIADASQVLYQAPADKDPMRVDALSLKFSPQRVDMPVMDMTIGKNDLNASGFMENFFGYFLSNGILQGGLNLKSNYLNINSFMDGSDNAEPKPTDTGHLQAIQIPNDLDLNLDANVKTLIYNNLKLEEVAGKVAVKDGKLDLSGVHADMLGGEFTMNGKYDSRNDHNPFTDLSFNISHLNIAQSVQYFGVLKKFGSLAQRMDGLFNASLKMNSSLDDHMSPLYNSLNMEGSISVTDAVVKGLKSLEKMAALLNIEQLKNLQLKNQTVKFRIKDGIMNLLDSITIPMGNGAVMKLSGITKLDQTISYGGWMKIPRKIFGAANSTLEGWLSKAKLEGASINVSEMVPVDFSIGGTVTDPKVSISLKGLKKALVTDITDQAKQIAKDKVNAELQKAIDAAKAKGDQLKAEAHTKAEQIRAEGRKGGDKIRSEGKTAADKVRSEANSLADKTNAEAAKKADELVAAAKDPLSKIAAQKAAQKLKDEAAKKAQDIRSKGETEAQKVENEANGRAQRVEDEANAKAQKLEDEAQQKADALIKEAQDKGQVK